MFIASNFAILNIFRKHTVSQILVAWNITLVCAWTYMNKAQLRVKSEGSQLEVIELTCLSLTQYSFIRAIHSPFEGNQLKMDDEYEYTRHNDDITYRHRWKKIIWFCFVPHAVNFSKKRLWLKHICIFRETDLREEHSQEKSSMVSLKRPPLLCSLLFLQISSSSKDVHSSLSNSMWNG